MKLWTSYALLGAGGRTPRIDLWDPSGGHVSTLATFPAGSTPYALARSPDGVRIVAGTKTGSVTVITSENSATPDANTPPVTWRLPHGNSPVLDAVFVAPRLVALANATGGCWLYDITTTQAHVTHLETNGRTICALRALEQGILAGLATDGWLVFWDASGSKMIEQIQVPHPASREALVSLYFWPKANALLYPDCEGQLVAFNVESGELTQLSAHSGGWHLAICTDARCLTFGSQDGSVKCWSPNLVASSPTLAGPENIIAGGSVGNDGAQMLLIRLDGSAEIQETDGEQLQLVGKLTGVDYRTCLGPDAAAVAASEAKAAHAEAGRVIQELQTQRPAFTERESMLAQLDTSGYRHVALALRADQAIQNNHLPEALRFSTELVGLLPWEHPKSQRSLLRHLNLLERVWLLEEAAKLAGQIAAVWPELVAGADLKRRAGYRAVLTEPFTTCEADLPVPELCECAAAAGKPLHGRWLIKRLRSYSCGLEIAAETFLSKYAEVRAENRSHLPTAATPVISYLSRRGVVRRPSVLFTALSAPAEPAFELCLSLDSSRGQSVISPLVIFFAPPPRPGTTVSDHNNWVGNLFLQMKNQDSIRSGLNMVLERSIHVFRRLLTAGAGPQPLTTK